MSRQSNILRSVYSRIEENRTRRTPKELNVNYYDRTKQRRSIPYLKGLEHQKVQARLQNLVQSNPNVQALMNDPTSKQGQQLKALLDHKLNAFELNVIANSAKPNIVQQLFPNVKIDPQDTNDAEESVAESFYTGPDPSVPDNVDFIDTDSLENLTPLEGMSNSAEELEAPDLSVLFPHDPADPVETDKTVVMPEVDDEALEGFDADDGGFDLEQLVHDFNATDPEELARNMEEFRKQQPSDFEDFSVIAIKTLLVPEIVKIKGFNRMRNPTKVKRVRGIIEDSPLLSELAEYPSEFLSILAELQTDGEFPPMRLEF